MEKTLEQRIEELEAEAKAAKEAAEAKADAAKPYVPKEPWKRYDPTAALGMPQSAIEAMVKVVPDFRGVAVEQGRRSRPGMFPEAAPSEPVVRGSGWREPRGLEPPPGIKVMDQMVDVQDAIDRRNLEKQLGMDRTKKEVK